MKKKKTTAAGFRDLPAVGVVLNWPRLRDAVDAHGRSVVRAAIQGAVKDMRRALKHGEPVEVGDDAVLAAVTGELERLTGSSLVPVINATGILVHTNLGRAPLSEAAINAVVRVSGAYSNLEYDLEKGARGSRHDHVSDLLAEITGAEAALAVNNNAGAVLLALNTLAEGRSVVVSRGELVEIGGSFRIPEIMRKSGCRLVEVGTTNKTRLDDYRDAVTDETALFLKVHKSNFSMEGFVEEVAASDLAELGRELGVGVVEDLGSGSLITGGDLGVPHEPTVPDSVRAGCDLVTFSGDKLLGGPQAGVICGKSDAVRACRENPLARALRVDKMTIAALEATLAAYRDPVRAGREIPILRAASRPLSEVRRDARSLARRLSGALKGAALVTAVPTRARVGGGALPLHDLPSFAVALVPESISAGELEKRLRLGTPPVIVRVADDRVLFDLRSVLDGQERVIENTLKTVLLGGARS